MSPYPDLSLLQLSIAGCLFLGNALLTILLRLNIAKTMLISGIRTVVQLTLLGFMLTWIFSQNNMWIILALITVMTLFAAWTGNSRAHFVIPGGFLQSLLAILLSSWTVGALTIFVILGNKPWWTPQILIPFLGILLGNSLTGIALAYDCIVKSVLTKTDQILTHTALGASHWEAGRDLIRDAIRTGTMPITNAMMIAGIVSLPGAMTGQILAGVDPFKAATYQILIMLLIASNTLMGSTAIVLMSYRSFFNNKQQLIWSRILHAKKKV